MQKQRLKQRLLYFQVHHDGGRKTASAPNQAIFSRFPAALRASQRLPLTACQPARCHGNRHGQERASERQHSLGTRLCCLVTSEGQEVLQMLTQTTSSPAFSRSSFSKSSLLVTEPPDFSLQLFSFQFFTQQVTPVTTRVQSGPDHRAFTPHPALVPLMVNLLSV